MMARKLDALPAQERNTVAVYPWAEWLDGTARELIGGEDFTCSPASFRSIASQAAARRGLRVRFRKTGEKSLAMQAWRP